MGQVRKKKKRRKKRYLLKLVIVLALFVGAYFFFTSEIFDIQKIQVEQNSYYTAEQVISIAGAKTGVSLFKVHTGKMKDRLLGNPYIQTAKVSRHLPNRLIITVVERKEFAAVAMENVDLSQAVLTDQGAKKDSPASVPATGSSPPAVQTTAGAAKSGEGTGTPAVPPATTGTPAPAGTSANGTPAAVQTTAGAVKPGGTPAVPPATTGTPAPAVPPGPPKIGTLFIVLDKDGMVLRKTDKSPTIPVIYGLTVKEAEPGKPLKVEENLMFSDTVGMVKSMNENDLFFKKIQVNPVVIKAYIYDNLICEGPPDVIEKSMKSLKDTLYVLYQQGIQRGVIHASGDDHMPFTFSPVIEQ